MSGGKNFGKGLKGTYEVAKQGNLIGPPLGSRKKESSGRPLNKTPKKQRGCARLPPHSNFLITQQQKKINRPKEAAMSTSDVYRPYPNENNLNK